MTDDVNNTKPWCEVLGCDGRAEYHIMCIEAFESIDVCQRCEAAISAILEMLPEQDIVIEPIQLH